MSRTYTFYLAVLDGAICVFFIIHGFILGHFFVHSRTVRLDVMQGFLIGVGLVPNTDGSVNIYIQNTAPVGHESNWLPAPAGKFILWLRVYEPGAAILDGTYKVPPVAQAR